MALFKLIKSFEVELKELEQIKSKFFLIQMYKNYKIKKIKIKIKELKIEVNKRKQR